MRDGWREAHLGDVATIIMGQSPPGPSYNTEGRGLPFIQGSAEFGVHHPMPVKWCDAPKKVAQSGDLLVSVRAPVGDLNQADRTLAIGRGLAIIRGRRAAVTRFLSLAIEHRQGELRSRSGGGMFQSTTRDGLAGLSLILPPLDEQRRIGDLISTVDEGIDAASTVAEAARKARKALLGDLLSDERAMRNGWREARLGDLSEVIGGGTPPTSTPDFWNGDVVWLTPTEVVAAEGTVVTDSQRKITRTGLRSSGAKLLPPGTVLLTSRATVGAVAMAGCELATNQGFQSLVAGDDLLPWFLLIWIQHNKVEFTRRASGSTFPEISRSEVRRIPILLPPLDEQQRIAGLVKAVDAEADAAEAVAGSMRDVRSALLSDLLAGDHEIPASYDGGMG